MITESLLPDLSVRLQEPELMDSPGLDRGRHVRALEGLARINVLSLAAGRIWSRIVGMAAQGAGPLRILDVACGGGDVAMAIKRRADRVGVRLEVAACDINPVALDFARARARSRGLEIAFFERDAMASELPGGFDLVCSSLFLHHLDSEGAVGLLRRLARSGRSVLVQDLLRTPLGYLLAATTVRVVTRSDVVRVDGVRSVRAAFSISEVEELARKAGLSGARIRRCWPERFLLTWDCQP